MWDGTRAFGLVIKQSCLLYETPGDRAGTQAGEVSDEIFSGWAVEILPGEPGGTDPAWAYVQTHYGYTGYVRAEDLRALSEEELTERQDQTRFYLVRQAAADVLDAPRVQGQHLETLVRGSILELVEDARTVAAACGCEGWCRVRTAAGHEGYVHAHFLAERKDDDGYLLAAAGEAKDTYFVRRAEKVLRLSDEAQLREALVRSAEGYLGAQYRWAGKSSMGLDCSGLTFMSYMQNGILLYRDAWIREAYPVREIDPAQLDRGDLIFFEGHVAMYLGGGRFIHSTGFAPDACVRMNSLLRDDPLYRPDLPEKILWYGSVFAGKRCSKTREQMRAVLEENKRKARQGIGGVALKEDPEGRLLEEITRSLSGMRGNISFFYQNLTSGRQAFYAEKAPHVAASVIKLYLMAALFKSFEEGTIDPLEQVQVSAPDKVPSCGVLYYLRDQAAFSVRDLIELMIIVSDNTATNLLFDLYEKRFGPDRLGRVIREELGFGDTAFNRKMFDSEKAASGIENYTTAADTADLLGRIWRGELVSPEASARMLQILKDQRLNGKIPFRLHALKGAPVIAHKTGEDTETTHDVALIEGSHPMLLGFLGNDVDVPALERLMADSAARLYALG